MDLLAPYAKGGKIGMFQKFVGRTVSLSQKKIFDLEFMSYTKSKYHFLISKYWLALIILYFSANSWCSFFVNKVCLEVLVWARLFLSWS